MRESEAGGGVQRWVGRSSEEIFATIQKVHGGEEE